MRLITHLTLEYDDPEVVRSGQRFSRTLELGPRGRLSDDEITPGRPSPDTRTNRCTPGPPRTPPVSVLRGSGTCVPFQIRDWKPAREGQGYGLYPGGQEETMARPVLLFPQGPCLSPVPCTNSDRRLGPCSSWSLPLDSGSVLVRRGTSSAAGAPTHPT